MRAMMSPLVSFCLLLSWGPIFGNAESESSPYNLEAARRLNETIESIVASQLQSKLTEATQRILEREAELQAALDAMQRKENQSQALIRDLQGELEERRQQLVQLEEKVQRLESQQASGSSEVELRQAHGNLTRIQEEIQQCKDTIINLQSHSNSRNSSSLDIEHQIREERNQLSQDFFKQDNSTLLKLMAKRSCFDWMQSGFDVTGDYWIDPDGLDSGEPPIRVYCDMVTGFTFVHHDKEDLESVSACAGAGCYSTNITYEGNYAQIIALIRLSETCQQHTKFTCKATPLKKDGDPLSWWVDRNGDRHYYWAANDHDDHTCTCGLSHSCVNPTYSCNCDAALAERNLSDEGYISNITALPITQLFLGGVEDEKTQLLKYSIGPLRCYGHQTSNHPSTCQDLWNDGNTKTGYYILGSSSSLRVSFCDMRNPSQSQQITDMPLSSLHDNWNASNARLTQLVSKTEALENILNSTRKDNVMFNAISTQRKTTTHRYIDFDTVTINIGNVYSSSSGLFTAPSDGMYFFYTQIRKNDGSESGVSINKNDLSMAYAYNGDTGYKDNINVAVILNLSQGDKVGVYLRYGNADIHDKKGTLFMGFLLNM